MHSHPDEEVCLLPDAQPGTTRQLQLNQGLFQGKCVTIVLDLEVLQKGDMEGKKIGNPVTIGPDGKVGFLLRF